MARTNLRRRPLSLLLLPPLCSGSLTIPSALLCYDRSLEQELLEGVDFPDVVASIASQLAEARKSVCGWSVVATSTRRAEETGEGGRGTSAGASTTAGGEDMGRSSTRLLVSTTSASPLQTSFPPSTSSPPSSSLSTSKSSSTSTASPPIVSAIPSLTTTTLTPTSSPHHLLPILLGVLLPLLLLALVAVFLFFRRRRHHQRTEDSSYPYLADTPSHSDAPSSQQPFWSALRRPKFVQMTSSFTTATVPWDPLPPRPGGSQSTLPFLAGDPDSAERRALYLVGTNVGSPLPTSADRPHEEGEWPWEMGVNHGAGDSEVELGGGRPTMKAVEIPQADSRAESRTTRGSFESGGTLGNATGI
ncbi:hypothetical protein BDY24DRAFT_395674 [Mrakia frigida]|uniref:uncharacterized protein n=1 Tax=Mrakia frigida TaxID=29902 RepID=UPI003FCC26C1